MLNLLSSIDLGAGWCGAASDVKIEVCIKRVTGPDHDEPHFHI